MYGLPQARADSGHGSVLVCSRTQVGDRAQELVGMPFFLERIRGRIGLPQKLHPRGPHLEVLPLARRSHEFAVNGHGRPDGYGAQDIRTRNARVHHDLNIGQTGAVVQFQKRKILGVPPGAHPAHHTKRPARAVAAKDILDGSSDNAHRCFQVKVKGQRAAPPAMVAGRDKVKSGEYPATNAPSRKHDTRTASSSGKPISR